MKQFWNQRYGEAEYAYGTEPNAFFRAYIERAERPGRILLPGEGEGRNGVHAAAAGWEVVAYDYSEAGRQKALRLAEERGVSLDYRLSDYEGFEPEPEAFDAVALIFAHMPGALRRTVHRRLAEALRPGGTLIIEAFSKAQIHNNTGGPRNLDMLYTVAELAEDFAGLSPERLDPLVRPVHEGPHHNGDAAVIQGVFIRR